MDHTSWMKKVFEIAGAIVAIGSVLASGLIWIAGINTSADKAHARIDNVYSEVSGRQDRMSAYMQKHFDKQDSTNQILLDRTARIEETQKSILKELKK